MGELIHFPKARYREGWVAKRHVAQYFGVSERTIERWVAQGCPHVRVGGSVRFRLGEVEGWHRGDAA